MEELPLTDGWCCYKVGRSLDPAARLRSLQTGNPATLRLVGTCKRVNDCDALEHALHRALRAGGAAQPRDQCEWFKLDAAGCDRVKGVLERHDLDRADDVGEDVDFRSLQDDRERDRAWQEEHGFVVVEEGRQEKRQRTG